jgi:Tfp pilus assembly pilus retraction ATPase PilT
MKTMNQSLFELVLNEKIDKDIALAKSPRPKELQKLFDTEL